MRYLIICLSAYFFSLNLAVADVRENLTYSYYPVIVKSNLPLFPQLLAASSIREEGTPYVGITNWHVRWNFKWNTDRNGACRITSSSTQLTADILLPRLSNANVLQMASFDRFIIALRQHELGHYNIATEAARKIDSDLNNIPAMSNCSALEAYANTTSKNTMDRFNERSRQYDRDTNHGKTQGAWING